MECLEQVSYLLLDLAITRALLVHLNHHDLLGGSRVVIASAKLGLDDSQLRLGDLGRLALEQFMGATTSAPVDPVIVIRYMELITRPIRTWYRLESKRLRVESPSPVPLQLAPVDNRLAWPFPLQEEWVIQWRGCVIQAQMLRTCRRSASKSKS